jgi:hypothetical protein
VGTPQKALADAPSTSNLCHGSDNHAAAVP